MGETEPAVPLASLPIILKQSDLDELRNPSRFLSDVFVEFYFSYIKYLFPSDSILFVPPTVCFLLANSKDTEDIQGCIKPLELTSKDLIIFPVNNGGYHWSLLVYHRGLDFFVHHDSMRGSNNFDAKKLYKSVKGFVKEKVVDNENPEKEEEEKMKKEKKKKKKKKKKKRVWHHDPRYMRRRLQYGVCGRPYGRYGTPYGEFGRPNGRGPYDMPDFDGFGGPNYGMPRFGGRPCDRSFGRIFRHWPNDMLPYCEYGSPCGEYGGPDEFEFSLSPHDRMRFAEYLKNNQDYEDKDDLKHTKHVKAMIKRFKQEQQMKMFYGCNDVERPEPMDETSNDDEWTDASSSDDEGAPEFHQWSTPQQTNAHDCGLYVMAIAKVICKWYSSDSLDKEEDWRQEIQMNVDVSLQSTMRFHILQLIESASAGELGTVTCTVEEPKSPALEDKDANGCGTSRPMSTNKEDQNAKAAIDCETSGPKEENQDANGCGTALPEIESCSSMEVDTSGPLSCGVEENKDANDCGTVLLPEIESRIGMEETSGSVSCGLEFKSSLHFQRRAGQGAEFHSQPENQEANDCGTTLKWPLPLTESCCDGMKEKEEEVAKDFESSSRTVSSSGVEEKGEM